MSDDPKVPLQRIIKELSLKTVLMPANSNEIFVMSKDVNRPGLALTGYLEHVDTSRIIIIGHAETAFLSKYPYNRRYEMLDKFLSMHPPAVIVTSGLPLHKELIQAAKKNGVPLLRSDDNTSSTTAALVVFMSAELAPRTNLHGVLVEVYGEGALIMGDSGVGKSEAAIELIKRGHRLIADDQVDIKRVSKTSLVGSAPENIRHFIELRGIGIINARRIFGMGAVKISEKIDIIIKLEMWDNNQLYDRVGVESEYMDVLGIDVPVIKIPVKPGRNLAVIIEVAAMNNRQKKLGYNAAKELLAGLGMGYSVEEDTDFNF